MAVILNDLLGISTSKRSQESVNFPTYEEFTRGRSRVGEPISEQGFDRDFRDNRGDMRNFENDRYFDNYATDRSRAFEKEEEYYGEESNYRSFPERNYSAQTRGSGVEYNGSNYKRVSSLSSADFTDEQALTRTKYSDNCLYAVRNDLSGVSDAQSLEDELFERLAFVSPLAISHPARNSSRKVAAEPIARKARLSLKGKIILAIYIALAVLVTTLIAINASGLNGSVNANAGQVSGAEYSTEVENQATSTSAGEMSANFIYLNSEYSYAESTNWFDRFCDKIGKIFS